MNEKPKKLSPWHRLHGWIHRHPRRTLIIGGAALIVAASTAALMILYQPPVKKGTEPVKVAPKPPAKKFYSPLTGVEVDSEATAKRAVTGIMIENSPDARPQSGLKAAGVVYEAIAEGGITRFLALYQQDKPGLIGPVRSLRMYYVDWLAPYNASIAHVGGSAAALAEVRNGNYRDLDQFFNAGSYWRASDRYAPHNVYTNFEKLDALNEAKGFRESAFTSFERADGKPSEAPNATAIDIGFSSPLYSTRYEYDAASNTYLRSQGGAPHDDREAGRIQPNVVVAITVDMEHVMEDGYRESIKTSGSGRAVIFQNGTATEASWRKNERGAALELIDANGKAIALNRGQTWIAAIPTTGGSVSWQ